MTYTQFMDRRRDLEYQIAKGQQMIEILDKADMPEDRRDIWMATEGERVWQLKTELANLIQEYYGTVATDTFFNR